MSNSEIPMARSYDRRFPSRSRRLLRSREAHRSCASVYDPKDISLFNSNDSRQRRTASASSSRSDIRADALLDQPTQQLTCQSPQEQIISLSQLSLRTTEQSECSYLTRECLVCATEKFLDQFEGVYSDTCVHIERVVCNSCLYENTKCLVEDSMTFYENVTCPEANCYAIFDYHGIREILLFIGKNNVLFEQYDQHLISRVLEQMPDFVWCAYNCGSGQLYNIGEPSNPVVTCGKCNRCTCVKHRVVWHTDMSCDQYDLLNSQPSENDANKKWLELFTKQCPQCQWHIQKNEGCDHMTCRSCKHEFCWECLVDYKYIRDIGHSQHKTACGHYQPDSSTPPGRS